MSLRRVLIPVVVMASIAAILGYRSISPSSRGIASRGGASLVVMNGGAEPFYRQMDPRWGHDTIGGSGETLSAVGCTVSCLSMAATHLGVPGDPGQLNARLKAADGYTERGWLMWNVAAQVLGDKVAIEVCRIPRHRRIDAALRGGDVVIAKVLLWGSVPHWVLIVGKDGHEYLVKNPLKEENALQRLSELSGTIEAIRIVKGVAGS